MKWVDIQDGGSTLQNNTSFRDHVAQLEKIIILRDELARLLGYNHHAALKRLKTR